MTPLSIVLLLVLILLVALMFSQLRWWLAALLTALLLLLFFGVTCSFSASTVTVQANAPAVSTAVVVQQPVAVTCKATTPYTDGLKNQGHQPVQVIGPSVISVWDPAAQGTEWIFTLPEGQALTITKPGQVFLYPPGCNHVLEVEARKHGGERGAQGKRIVYGRPPSGI